MTTPVAELDVDPTAATHVAEPTDPTDPADPADRPVRVVVADDGAYLRRHLRDDLTRAGFDVVAEAHDLPSTLSAIRFRDPDVVVADVRMPPNHADEGMLVAEGLRGLRSGAAVVLLTSHLDLSIVDRLLQLEERGVAYLQKDALSGTGGDLVRSIRSAMSGGVEVDPEICRLLVERRRKQRRVEQLTPTQRVVLVKIAEGLRNRAIAEEMRISERTVESHVNAIFTRLGIEESDDLHRRVRATLWYLRHLG